MLWSVFYKEFLELKSDRGAIRTLLLQSIGYGLWFPALTYLRLVGVLPEVGLFELPIELSEAERLAMMTRALEFVGLLLMPAFLSLLAAQLSIPSIAQEAGSRTLERLLSLPLSWRDIVFGKLLFYFTISLASAYIIALTYFLPSSVIAEQFQPPALATFLLVLVPAVVFYTVSAGLFASARARSVRMANVFGGFLTSALFFGAFFVAWAVGVEPGRDFMLTVGFVLLAIGLTLAYFTARVDPEKLLYGRGS